MVESKRLSISPYCRRLRSKRMLFIDRPPRVEEDILDGSGACWCEHTQDGVGPDGEIVDPEDCRTDRRCFEDYAGPTS